MRNYYFQPSTSFYKNNAQTLKKYCDEKEFDINALHQYILHYNPNYQILNSATPDNPTYYSNEELKNRGIISVSEGGTITISLPKLKKHQGLINNAPTGTKVLLSYGVAEETTLDELEPGNVIIALGNDEDTNEKSKKENYLTIRLSATGAYYVTTLISGNKINFTYYDDAETRFGLTYPITLTPTQPRFYSINRADLKWGDQYSITFSSNWQDSKKEGIVSATGTYWIGDKMLNHELYIRNGDSYETCFIEEKRESGLTNIDKFKIPFYTITISKDIDLNFAKEHLYPNIY